MGIDLNLSEYFDANVRAKGLKYYKEDRILSLKSNEENYKAKVEGGNVYDVFINLERNTIKNMSCTCPHAQRGFNCKHMAAVCFAINNLNLDNYNNNSFKKYDNDEVILPFNNVNDNSGESYKYFDMNKITGNAVIFKKIYEEALQIINSGIMKFSFDVSFAPFFGNQIALVMGSIRDENFKLNVSMIFDKNKIESTSCSRPDCEIDLENEKIILCKHQVALLIFANDYIQKNNPGDETDSASSEFLDEFYFSKENIIKNNQNIQNEKKHIKLEPRIICNYDNLTMLSFKIGFNKLFVLKDIGELIKSVNNKKIFVLGKANTINFAIDEFYEKSKQYFDFLQRTWGYIENYNHKYRDYISEKKEIIFDKSCVDEFFDIAENSYISYKNDYDSNLKNIDKLYFCKSDFKLKFKLSENLNDTNQLLGIKLYGEMPKLISGSKYQYFIENNKFMRISNENFEHIYKLSKFESEGQISLNFGRKRISEFYNYVLPELKKIADIHEDNFKNSKNIKEIIAIAPSFEFFLDAKDGVPICDAKVFYEKKEYSIFNINNKNLQNDFRDFRLENKVLELIKEYFPEYDNINNSFKCKNNEDNIMNAALYGSQELLKFGSVNSTARFDNLKNPKRVKISIGVSFESDLLNLNISSSEVSHHELLEILNSLKLKKHYHKLKTGEYINIDDNIKQLDIIFDSLKLSPKEFVTGKIHIPAYRAIYLDKMLDKNKKLISSKSDNFKNIIESFESIKSADFQVPDELKNIMRDYQIFGYKWLKTLEKFGFGGILADDMGLGKTLQIISLIYSSKKENNLGTSIVICPTSLVYNWCEEFAHFAPELKIISVTGISKKRAEIINNYKNWDILITSYDLLKRDILNYEDKTFDYLILDEAQFIKNHSTSNFKSVKLIKSKKKFALSGTPIENRLSELWSIFDFIMPEFLNSYNYFKQNYETPIIKNNETKIKQKLKDIVSPFILRRIKSEVLKDLPDKIEKVYYANFEKKQQEIYDGQVLKIQNQLLKIKNERDFNTSKLKILAELTRIRQICCDPTLIFENYKGTSAKKEVCIEIIENAIENNSKILLFSQFTTMLDILKKELEKTNISYYEITGKTDKKERLELVNKFNKDKTPIFMISLKAGGTGLNLTGADVVIHYDPWWNVSAQNQATDRAHRIGQTKIVNVYKIIAKNTIEEKILKLQNLKKDLADSILDSNSKNIVGMTKEDILNLFSD